MRDPALRLNAALTGRYEIERELGAGGMATVYLARDLKHERKVALKVLKPELAAVVGAERFLTEIRTTANLQHPHILPLHDSGEADGLLFYVMPHVEGESLRERLDREHQLPVDEAVRIATNVAEALDYAHRHGVIHRDIKPANILLQDGKPVVSDFGIALAVTAGGAGRLTETGLSLGTPHYMSPEQATGELHVGAPTDIYALGCVLYEMLVAEPPYTGGTPQAILGKIVTGEAEPVSRHRKSVPPNVDAAVRKAIEKVPADRFSSAGALARAFGDPAFRYGDQAGANAVSHSSRWKAVALSACGVAAVAVAVSAWAFLRPAPSTPIERFGMPFLPDQEPFLAVTGTFALSPDGTTLVYEHQTEEGSVLMLRRWDQLAATVLRETGAALRPTFSPDGERIAFIQGNQIKTLALAGGPAVTLGEALGGGGAAPIWGSDGFVYGGGSSGAFRIPASGGAAEQVARRSEGAVSERVSVVLPGGVLLGNNFLNGRFEIRRLDLESGESEHLLWGRSAQYAPTGHLLYEFDGTLMAAPFDANRVELTGPSIPLLEGVLFFSISESGKLFYSTSSVGANLRQLVWVTRTGEVTPIDPEWTYDRGANNNQGWSIDPDGRRIAVREFTAAGYDIWIKQLDRGPRQRLTFDEATEQMPTWAPDGTSVTYLTGTGVWSTPANGIGAPQLVAPFPRGALEVRWSPDGTWLLLRTSLPAGATGPADIYTVRPGLDTVASPLLASPQYNEIHPMLSPNGRWLAYASNESGRWEVYVRPFPDVDAGRVQISVQGGQSPLWSSDGRELFFLDAAWNMIAIGVSTESDFEHGPLEPLFRIPTEIDVTGLRRKYDVAPDGRFIMARFVDSDSDDSVPAAVLVNNFFEELKRLPAN